MIITIPDDCEKINVLITGGVDSTLVLYLLLREVSEKKVHIPVHTYNFLCTHQSLQRASRNSVSNILHWLDAEFSIPITHKDVNRKRWIRNMAEDVLITEGGYVYSGCNLVVTNQFTPTIWIENDTPPVRGDAFSEKHLRPLINIDKIDILKLYKKYNIMNLFELTHSCGVSTTPCGGCYFCMERQWALDNIDNF
jgi:7-cyano-7-deazaguanine synthase in queuosine biosynthesis